MTNQIDDKSVERTNFAHNADEKRQQSFEVVEATSCCPPCNCVTFPVNTTTGILNKTGPSTPKLGYGA
jgi:hypothetical protein